MAFAWRYSGAMYATRGRSRWHSHAERMSRITANTVLPNRRWQSRSPNRTRSNSRC